MTFNGLLRSRGLVSGILSLVLVACGGGATNHDATASPQRAAANGTISATAFLDWAEGAFPAYFSTHVADSYLSPYTYRYYPSSGHYLGVADNAAYLMGPVSGGNVMSVGALSSFECLVDPTRCAQQAVSVPNDINGFIYPLGYALSGAAYTQNHSPCDLAPARIEFPASYLGKHVLPVAAGAPLAAQVQRGIIMKDVWDAANATFAQGCSGSAREAFTRTLQRLRTLNIDTVAVTPWTFVDTSQSAWRIANPVELDSSTMSDEDLTWAAGQIRANGMKVHWVNQIQGSLGAAIPAATTENVGKFMDALDPYMVGRATLAQQLGIEAMYLSCVCWFQSSTETDALVETRMAEIGAKMKLVYQGKLIYENLKPTANAALRAQADYATATVFPSWVNLSDTEKANLDMTLLTAKLREAVRNIAMAADASKPMIWRIHFGSRANIFDTGYLEETFCTDGFNVITGSNSACIQQGMVTDFSLQAMLHQVALAAIAEQTIVQTHSVEVEYWQTDAVVPSSTFPNLATSIRNKPAEAIVRDWFRR